MTWNLKIFWIYGYRLQNTLFLCKSKVLRNTPCTSTSPILYVWNEQNTRDKRDKRINNSENKHKTRFHLYKMWSVNSWPQRTVTRACKLSFLWLGINLLWPISEVSLEINNEKVVLRHETKPVRCTERNMLWIMNHVLVMKRKCYESHSVWSVFPLWFNRCDQEERRR